MRTIKLFAVLTVLATLEPAAAQDLIWTRQAGTTERDEGNGVAVDSAGNAFIVGTTWGSLGGPSAGSYDTFLAKYDASGTLLWTHQLGTPGGDYGSGVAVDSTGNAFIVGGRYGGVPNPDYFLAKYDASGTLLWKRQTGSSKTDFGRGLAVDRAGNAYIAGTTWGSLAGPNAGEDDIFLAKYDASGTLLWTRQAGTPEYDRAAGLTVDSAGNAYITGQTDGSLGGPNAGSADAILTKYDASGVLLWTRQTGTPERDTGLGVAVDSGGNAYITGSTGGSLGGPNAGHDDVFLAKYDALGVLLWIRQTGTSNTDRGQGVGVDSGGNAYVTGYKGSDYFLAKYDPSGTLLWTRQAGSSAGGLGRGVALDSEGSAYITGYTRGSLGGPSAGGRDIFLAKFGDASCYADCDTSSGIGVLDMADFLCFQDSFVNAEPYACDCDTSTGNGVCDVFDFLCFQNAFVGGCP